MTDRDEKPCPHCGRVGIKRKVRAYGWATEVCWGDGSIELDIEDVEFSRTATVRCLECGKIRKDVKWPRQ